MTRLTWHDLSCSKTTGAKETGLKHICLYVSLCFGWILLNKLNQWTWNLHRIINNEIMKFSFFFKPMHKELRLQSSQNCLISQGSKKKLLEGWFFLYAWRLRIKDLHANLLVTHKDNDSDTNCIWLYDQSRSLGEHWHKEKEIRWRRQFNKDKGPCMF